MKILLSIFLFASVVMSVGASDYGESAGPLGKINSLAPEKHHLRSTTPAKQEIPSVIGEGEAAISGHSSSDRDRAAGLVYSPYSTSNSLSTVVAHRFLLEEEDGLVPRAADSNSYTVLELGDQWCVVGAIPYEDDSGVIAQLIAAASDQEMASSCMITYSPTVSYSGAACAKLEEDFKAIDPSACVVSPFGIGSFFVGDPQERKLTGDPYNTKIDLCVNLLVDLFLPFDEYNCWFDFPEVLGCVALPQCCIPGLCLISIECGFARTVMKLVASAGDVHCFEDVTAGDIWNRVKERAISVGWTLLTGGLDLILCQVVELDIDIMYAQADGLHSHIIDLMTAIRAIDDTSLFQSWDAAALDDVKINDKASLGVNGDIWLSSANTHAITLGLAILFRDTIDVEQLARNPPLNVDGNPVTIVDLQDGTVDDPSENFNSAISVLLHEMVHVRQYTELGICEFQKNYLLEVAFNGYDGASYEVEAYTYEEDIIPYKICGQYCIEITNDEPGCRAACPRETFRSLQAAPVALCRNLVIETAVDSCEADANIDNGSFDIDSNALTFTQVLSGPYPKGINIVTLTVMDDFTASDTCQGVVTVVDRVDPVLTCPPDAELAVDDACLAEVPEMSASVTDNCDFFLPNTPAQGGETVTLEDDRMYVFTASDTSGNSASCDVSITVVDNIGPTINAPLDAVVECHEVPEEGSQSPIAQDNCEVASVDYLGQTRDDGACADNYTLHRTWSVDDTSGNFESDMQVISVEDTAVPVLSCNTYDISPNDVSSSSPVAFTLTASDNCDPAVAVRILSYTCTKTKNNGRTQASNCKIELYGDTAQVSATGGIGTAITFHVRATDRCGNSAEELCSLNVLKKKDL